MATILTVSDLSVSFGQTPILSGLSFSVSQGASLAVIGPNGAGKTVLFRTLIGSIPHRGVIAWAPGTRIGYVPQKLDLERNLPLTATDFLIAKVRSVGASTSEIARVTTLVRFSPSLLASPIGTLSGGQFQRLLVAFALIGSPSVLLFDEPTAGVDERGEEALYEMIERLRRAEGITVLLISHDLSIVHRHATEVLCLNRERVCFGTPRDVLTSDKLAELYGHELKYHTHA